MRPRMSGAVEAQPVDHATVAIEAKQTWTRIAGLRTRRHRADFDKAEAERQQIVRRDAILVETRGKADRVRENQSKRAHPRTRIIARRLRQPGALQREQRRIVRALRIERMQERPRQLEQRTDHGTSPEKSWVPSSRSGSLSTRSTSASCSLPWRCGNRSPPRDG